MTRTRAMPPRYRLTGLHHLVNTREHPVVVAAHHRLVAVLAYALQVEIERRPTVGAALLHGAAVRLGRGVGRTLERPVLGPLCEVLVAPDDLVVGGVDVVVGATGQQPQHDGVVGGLAL